MHKLTWLGGLLALSGSLLSSGLVGCAAAESERGPLVESNEAAICGVPEGPYGVAEGTTWQNWQVSDCEGNATALYNNAYCNAEATVYIRMQGWCGNCQAEAPSLMEDLIAPNEARGVRFLQVIQEDESYNPVDAEFCSYWRDRFGLGDHVYMDPERNTSRLVLTPGVPYTQGALPIIKVIDGDGVIRADLSGDPENWVHVQAALDEILGE